MVGVYSGPYPGLSAAAHQLLVLPRTARPDRPTGSRHLLSISDVLLMGRLVLSAWPGPEGSAPDPRITSDRASFAIASASCVPLPARMFEYPCLKTAAYNLNFPAPSLSKVKVGFALLVAVPENIHEMVFESVCGVHSRCDLRCSTAFVKADPCESVPGPRLAGIWPKIYDS